MRAHTASRTALLTSLMRARHTRADPHRVLDDPWGERLLPLDRQLPLYEVVRLRRSELPQAPDSATLQAALDAYMAANPAYPHVVVRSRYTEDALHRALARGVRQYVLIGAGLDSYALLRPPVAAQLTVIEIDHPATQAFKRQCMADAGVQVSPLTHFVPADLAMQGLLEVMRESPLRADEPAFFSWLGVSIYLTRQANMDTLRAVAAAAAPGSELVFTYFDQIVFEAPADATDAVKALRAEVTAVGEPFVSGFHPATLEGELRPRGYRMLEDATDAQVVRRYDPQGLNGFVAGERSRIAHLRVEAAPAAPSPAGA